MPSLRTGIGKFVDIFWWGSKLSVDHCLTLLSAAADGQAKNQGFRSVASALEFFSSLKLSCDKTPTFTVLTEYHNSKAPNKDI